MKLKPTWVELRGTLLVLLAIAITILFVGAAGAFWKREYALGTWLLAVGSSVAFAFFRRWKLDLVMMGLVWIMVNAGLTAMARPSTAGMFLAVGAALCIVLFGCWKRAETEPRKADGKPPLRGTSARSQLELLCLFSLNRSRYEISPYSKLGTYTEDLGTKLVLRPVWF